MENRIIEINNIGNIFIRAICDIDTRYKKDDIVATLLDKSINFNFRPLDKMVSRGSLNLLDYYERNLESISINDILLTEEVLDLFQESQKNNQFNVTIQKSNLLASNHQIFLSSEAKDQKVMVKELPNLEYIYHTGSTGQRPYISSVDIEDNETYTIIYETIVDGNLFDFKAARDLPYLSLEIQLYGNIEKENKRSEQSMIFMFVPRAKIQDIPVLAGPGSFSIEFAVIHDAEDAIQLGVING